MNGDKLVPGILLDAMPEGIILIDADMKIQWFSKGAQRLFGVKREEVLGTYLFELIEHREFEKVRLTKESVYGKKVVYSQYDVVARLDMIYVEELQCVMGVFRDISMEFEKEEQAYRKKMEAIEMAQTIIDKQMKTAQEIAGLLGETTAETKVTLTKIRDTIINNGE